MNTVDVYEKHAYKAILIAALTTLAGGTMFYHFFEKLTWVDAYYFSVTTLSTVGYGDIVPKTPGQKLFTTLYIFIGVGIITAFITATMKRHGLKLQEKYKAKQEKNKLS